MCGRVDARVAASSEDVSALSSLWIKSCMRRAVLLVSLSGCAVDERDVSVSMPPQEQSANADTCTPGTPGSICAGGLRRLCSGEGRWVLVVCDSGGPSAVGGAAGAPGAGTASSGGAGAIPEADPPPMGGAGGSLMVSNGTAGASMLPSSAAGGIGSVWLAMTRASPSEDHKTALRGLISVARV